GDSPPQLNVLSRGKLTRWACGPNFRSSAWLTGRSHMAAQSWSSGEGFRHSVSTRLSGSAASKCNAPQPRSFRRVNGRHKTEMQGCYMTRMLSVLETVVP